MNLTEPQAGSDLGALRTRAVPASDPRGASITGSPGRRYSSPTATTISPKHHPHGAGAPPHAPPGSRGISLFLVPKFLLDREAGRASATMSAPCGSRTSSASTRRRPACSPEDAVGCAHRRGPSRARGDVHDDEQRAVARRRAGRRDRRARLPDGARLRPDAGPGPADRPPGRAGPTRRSSTTPTCAAC